MTQRARTLSRRRFLVAAGAGTAASAAALVARTPASGAPGTSRRDSRSYHASEHINNYYRTTKI